MTEQGEGRWLRPDELQTLVDKERKLRTGDRVRSTVDDDFFITVGLQGLVKNAKSANDIPGVAATVYVLWRNDTESSVMAETVEIWVPVEKLAEAAQ